MSPKKILFATVPAVGHFSPLTGMAMELKNRGHDLRWYTGKMFADKLRRLGIHHYPFEKALEVNQFTVDEVFPQRIKLKPGVAQLKFDLKNLFIDRTPEYFEDIVEIRKQFPFEIFVCDATFTAGELVQKKFNTGGVAVGITPVMSSSKDLPPYGLGLTPDHSLPGKFRQKLMRFVAKNLLFKDASKGYNNIIKQYGLPENKSILFDIPAQVADIFLQSGTPGFEYERSDWPEKLKFVGPLLGYKSPDRRGEQYNWEEKLNLHKKIILITQGTYEPDHSKLIIPALEALKGEPYLLIVATGYHNTEELRAKYNLDNIIIEDFIDFDFIMPKAHLYVTNGGYGGTLLAIDHSLPMVAAGINEGKNEICARIGYFKLGINLKTEKPSPQKIRSAVEEILTNSQYKKNLIKLKNEFSQYNTNKLCADYILNVSKEKNLC